MYQVTFQDDTAAKFTSVTKAYRAIEQFWQCGNGESLKEVKSDLRYMGISVVTFCLDSSNHCIIKKI